MRMLGRLRENNRNDQNGDVNKSAALYAAQATSVINLELAPARFLFQKV
jgi:hypothetical protein